MDPKVADNVKEPKEVDVAAMMVDTLRLTKELGITNPMAAVVKKHKSDPRKKRKHQQAKKSRRRNRGKKH